MAAPYRYLQSDFSAGQLDPMVASNLNMGIRQIGLKESVNTVHNVNRTVSKRPGTMRYADDISSSDFVGADGYVTVQLSSGRTVMFVFTDEYVYVNYSGETQEIYLNDVIEGWEELRGGTFKFAVYQNFIYMIGSTVPLVKVIKVAETSRGDYAYHIDEIRGRWGTKPSCAASSDNVHFSAICFANGRLFLSRDNVVYASRIRVAGVEGLVEDSDGFPRWTLDFKLADEITTVDSEGNPETTREVYSSHAIEVRENDMYSSRIQWIANMGRIIIGTESAIFMSTMQEISPLTFDLVLTSSCGTCDINPAIVTNMLVFVGSDRRKIHYAYFNSENAGLIVGDATTSERNMFSGYIKGVWAYDYPEISIYVITEDKRTLFCQPTYTEAGSIFAWSEWVFPENVVPSAFFCERRLYRPPYNRICMSYERRDGIGAASQFMIICWESPYDDDTSRPMLDMMLTEDRPELEFTVHDTDVVFRGDRFGGPDDPITVFLYADGVAPVVFRNLEAIVSMGVEVPRDAVGLWDGDHLRADLKCYIGLEYETRIGLFQQILPNNSGIALTSKHRIKDISLMLFRSFGGHISVAGRKVQDLEYLQYGKSFYSASMYDFSVSGPYEFTGLMKITNPRYMGIGADNQDRDVIDEDRVVIASSFPFPFNLMAVSINYILTEVV